MKYWRFELLVLVLGAAVVAGSVAIGPMVNADSTEVVAQLLIAVVLVGAVHWGRDGGFITAIVATVVYVFMRIPTLAEYGLTSKPVLTIAARVLIYGLVGVVGGDVCGRVKYLFARLSGNPLLDDETGVYDARYAAQAIRSGIELWRRYQLPYSVVRLTADPPVFEELRAGRRRAALRRIAGAARSAVRLVDDVAYAGDGVFLILLPYTEAAGATMVEERLLRDMPGLVEGRQGTIGTEVFSCADRSEQLADLARALEAEPDDLDDGQPEDLRAQEDAPASSAAG